jgi:hypothetical protein
MNVAIMLRNDILAAYLSMPLEDIREKWREEVALTAMHQIT